MRRRAGLAAALALSAALAGGARAQEMNDALGVNDYPTNARAEYVLTCMAVNGQNREMLDRCSCTIDQIASVLPYEDYVEAETVLRMQQVTGDRAGMFRGMPVMTEIVAALRRAEAEGEVLCF